MSTCLQQKSKRLRIAITLPAALILAACSREPENPADTVYTGGDILLVAGDQPQYAEAIAVTAGKISYVGKRDAAQTLVGKKTVQVDLKGKTLIPVLHSSMDTSFVAADGPATPNCWQASMPSSKAEVLAALRSEQKMREKMGLGLFCVGYDARALGDQPLREADLDAAFPETSVVLVDMAVKDVLANAKARSLFALDTFVALKSATSKVATGGVPEPFAEGQPADFMILDKNPLKDRLTPLTAINIVQTIAEGKSVAGPQSLDFLALIDLKAAYMREQAAQSKLLAEKKRVDDARDAAAKASKKPSAAEKSAQKLRVQSVAKTQDKRTNQKKVLAPKAAQPAVEGAPKPKEVRFNMTQDGKKMTPEDFEAWMKAQGIRIVPAKPVEAPPADAKKDGG